MCPPCAANVSADPPPPAGVLPRAEQPPTAEQLHCRMALLAVAGAIVALRCWLMMPAQRSHAFVLLCVQPNLPVWPTRLQLMTPAAVLARTNGREAVSRGDVEEVHTLFRCGCAVLVLVKQGAACVLLLLAS